MSLTTALQILFSPPSGEVQFNCPWCTTRLALPQSDFQSERAVLCPRCNNPIDLTVQRRIAQQPAPPVPPPVRREVTVPAPQPPPRQVPPQRQAPAPGKSPPPQRNRAQTAQAPVPQRTLPPLEKKRPESGALDFDPEKPIDVDAAFKGEPIHVDDIDSLMSRSDLWSMAGPRRSVTGGSGGARPGEASGIVECPSCKYENAPVPPEFEFGKVRKCTWCGKPLPQ